MRCWKCRKRDRHFESESPVHGEVCDECGRVYELDITVAHRPHGKWREMTGMEKMANSIYNLGRHRSQSPRVGLRVQDEGDVEVDVSEMSVEVHAQMPDGRVVRYQSGDGGDKIVSQVQFVGEDVDESSVNISVNGRQLSRVTGMQLMEESIADHKLRAVRGADARRRVPGVRSRVRPREDVVVEIKASNGDGGLETAYWFGVDEPEPGQ